jgi:hypothetical protein
MLAEITAVCASQTIDLSVREIMLTQTDWAILHKLHEFFLIFVHPTKSFKQLDILLLTTSSRNISKMIKRVSEKQREWGMGSPLRFAC